jgi:(R)-2-hydroxyacyl-CoA dehydratese activating ATPase
VRQHFSPEGYLVMTWVMGIDIGSWASKGVIVKDGQLVASHILSSGINYRMAAHKLRDELLVRTGLSAEDIAYTVTTGHGASIIPFSNLEISDLKCCAKGTHYVFPSVKTVIDVQAQSSQVIKLDEHGQLIDFAVGEICASGSGYFLKVVANVLQIELKDIGPLSLKSNNPVTFTTGCAVFGESEAISRVSEGTAKEDILAGVHSALVDRISSLIKKIGLEEPCSISGGGGLNVGLVKKIEEQGIRLLVPPQPQIINALGAALFAEKQVKMSPEE